MYNLKVGEKMYYEDSILKRVADDFTYKNDTVSCEVYKLKYLSEGIKNVDLLYLTDNGVVIDKTLGAHEDKDTKGTYRGPINLEFILGSMKKSFELTRIFSQGKPTIMTLPGIGENKENDDDILYHLLKMKNYAGNNLIGESFGGAIAAKFCEKYSGINSVCLTNALGNSARITHLDVLNTGFAEKLGINAAYKLLIKGAKNLPEAFFLKYKHLVLYLNKIDDFFSFASKTKITVKENVSKIVNNGALVCIQYSDKDWISGMDAGINVDMSKMKVGDKYLVGTKDCPKMLIFRGKGEHTITGEELAKSMRIYEAVFQRNLGNII